MSYYKIVFKKELELYNLDNLEYVESRDKWCRGLCGMIISRLEIAKFIPDIDIKLALVTLVDKLIVCQKDMFVGDSLCHGNSGTIFVIKQLIENGLTPENKLQSILNKMLSQMWGKVYIMDTI